MNISSVNRKYIDLVNVVGKAALNALYPYDFEVYMMALELTDSEGNTIDYLSFPIMPESISKTEPKRTNIKVSATSTTVLSSASFIPEEITIKGNFGRTFNILLSPKEPSVQGVAYSINNGVYDLTQINNKNNTLGFKVPAFNVGIKTGYGAIRILKSIISKSNGVDKSGKPFRLYFYNLALGESYLVAVPSSGITVSQNLQKNMIWEYSLTLNTLAPLASLQSQTKPSSLLKVAATDVIQKGVNSTVSVIKSML